MKSALGAEIFLGDDSCDRPWQSPRVKKVHQGGHRWETPAGPRNGALLGSEYNRRVTSPWLVGSPPPSQEVGAVGDGSSHLRSYKFREEALNVSIYIHI